MKYRWTIRLAQAGIFLMLSGCMSFCMKPDIGNMLRAGFSPIKEDYYGYWMERPVVLTRPLRVYNISERYVASEYVGFGVLEAYEPTLTAKIFRNEDTYDIPIGSEVILTTFRVKNRVNSRLSQPGYFFWLKVEPFSDYHCQVIYFWGDADKLEPLPWKSDSEPEESFQPVDVEKLFPEGKWE